MFSQYLICYFVNNCFIKTLPIYSKYIIKKLSIQQFNSLNILFNYYLVSRDLFHLVNIYVLTTSKSCNNLKPNANKIT